MSERNIGSIVYTQDVGEEVSANGMTGGRSASDQAEICPYLGMETDRETRQAFPSRQNRCFRGEKGHPIEMLHQQQYCLHTGHLACPLFRADEADVGERYGYVVGREKRDSPFSLSFNWRLAMVGLLSLALLVAGVFLSRPLWQESDAGLAIGVEEREEWQLLLPAVWAGSSPTAASAPLVTPPGMTPAAKMAAGDAMTATASPTATAVPPTITPSPTPPPSATPTSPPPPTPTTPAVAATAPACGPPVHWVRYTVQPGDTMYSLAAERGVTVTAVRWANCLTTGRLESGWRLYLPPLSAGLPAATPPPAENGASEVTYFLSAPPPGSTVRGQVPIWGTVDFAPGQVRFYKIEIGQGTAPDHWTTLGSTHSQPAQNAVLEELWVDAFAPGQHTIRLVLVGPDGNYVGPPYEVGVFLVGSE